MKKDKFMFVILLLLIVFTTGTKAQITTDLEDEMKKFAENVMNNPDSIKIYTSKASNYFDYKDFLFQIDTSSLCRLINNFKKCNAKFYSMCKGEVYEVHSFSISFQTSIVYRNDCEEKAIQFCWILENRKWKLSSIIKTDYISCYQKEDEK